MIPLTAMLDDLDFDALVAIGRGRLPALAPGWTDYNYHDPGITLIDLLAWVADTQIYALGRDRVDERLAMAALIGLRPRGAVPATGVLYPPEPLAETSPADYDVAAGTRLTPAAGCAPRLEVLHGVTVLPLRLTQLTAEGGPGGTADLTDANLRARTSFAPFGVPPAPGAALVAKLAGRLPGRDVLLSLGVEIESGGTSAPEDDGLGAVRLFYRRRKGDEVPLECVRDTSVDMQRSGVIVVKLAADGPHQGRDEHEIVFRANRANALMPRLLRVAPNALPVAQKAMFERRDHRGTGRANQGIVIEPRSLFDSDEVVEGRIWRLTDGADGMGGPLVRVGEGEGSIWKAGELDGADPADRFYRVSEAPDGSRIELGFGNGVNGQRPKLHQPIGISLELSCGAGGNVASSVEWLLAAPRTRWHNPQPVTGGADAQNVADLLDTARRKLRDGRALTASRQIEEAALALPEAFGITRALVVDGWERGRRRPAAAATRTLLVARRGEASESDAWLRAVARSLRPRIPLAERLVVAAPAYRDFRVRARIAAAVGARPDQVAKAVRDELADRLTPGGSRGKIWPLGRDVSATAVAGWIRLVRGVAAVSDLALLDARGRVIGDTLVLGRDQLPRLMTEPGQSDIVVEAGRRP
jgi:baseplate J-like protein